MYFIASYLLVGRSPADEREAAGIDSASDDLEPRQLVPALSLAVRRVWPGRPERGDGYRQLDRSGSRVLIFWSCLPGHMACGPSRGGVAAGET